MGDPPSYRASRSHPILRTGRTGLGAATVVIALIAVLLLLLPGDVPRSAPSTPAAPRGLATATTAAGPAPAGPLPMATVGVPLLVNITSANLSSQFFGATVTNEVHMLRGETDALNATPARVLVWPGAMAGEDYNPLTNTHYDTYYGTPINALTNESQFIQMCRAIHCTAVMQLPAEIDNVPLAEAIVNYTEVNLSFTPAYWMIGNEPELWSHWQVPWSQWGYRYTTGPTPTQFGDEVVSYVNAIRQVDNTTPILGLPASGCTCGSWTFDQWIASVLKVTGSKIQSVAFHEYPAGWLGTGSGTLLGFYATLQGAAGIPVRMVSARQAVASACPGCNVSVWISELGSALSWSTYGPYALGFSGALSIASQMTQAMDVNLSNIDLFAAELATTNSWFDTSGNARPDYALYTEILNHLGSQAFSVRVPSLGHSIYAIDTIAPHDQGRRDLLVMNDNITNSIAFTPAFAEGHTASPVMAWSWNGSIHNTNWNATTWVEPFTPNPVPAEFPTGLPANYTLPPQSMVLFETYPSGASYVRINESGVPTSVPWYATVGSQLYRTTADNLSLLLPSGTYPMGSVPIPLPIGGKEYNPSEQLAGFAPPLRPSGSHTNTTLSFVPQWRVDVNASPAEGGTVTPDVGWWNDSAPLPISARPLPGYAFDRWSGWGPGSYNGSAPSTTIVPTGRITEKALFVPGFEVMLVANGLPPGIPWSITVRGLTTAANGSAVTIYEPTGAFGFSISPIPGYRILPQNGSFTVFAGPLLVPIKFQLITPPGLQFAVTFQVLGLPNGVTVPITVRDTTLVAGLSYPRFDLWNGSYAYSVGYVPGYHAVARNKTFNVTGVSLTVPVVFVPTIYPVSWRAVGLWQGANWTVFVDGNPLVTRSAWVSTALANGSYLYTIDVPANFTVSPRTGWVTVADSSSELSVVLSLAQYAQEFQAAGLAGGGGWSVRLGNATLAASAGSASFLAANGTYTFDVHPPDGFYAVPSHGNLTVAGTGAPLRIQFFPSSNQPSAALVAALSAGAMSVSLWIGASAVGGFLLVRRLRRR